LPVLLFCHCGSDRVDVTQWNASRARLRCFTCDREAWLDGFTISELDPGKLLVIDVNYFCRLATIILAGPDVGRGCDDPAAD
jgi:hypothetical protein